METLAAAVAALVIVIAGTGGYLLNRLKSLEKRDEETRAKALKDAQNLAAAATDRERAANKRADQLQDQVNILKPLAEKVPELERQMGVLCVQMENLQQRMEATENLAAERLVTIDTLTEDKRTLERRNEELVELAKTLTIERNVLKLVLGERLAKLDSIEAAQPSTDDISAAASEMVNDSSHDTQEPSEVK